MVKDLESKLNKLHTEVSDHVGQINSELTKLEGAIKEKERAIYLFIRDNSLSGIGLSAIGSFWLFVGVILGTLPL
jgi:hypothetical protein